MLSRAFSALTNLIYLVPLWVSRYRSRHPEERILAAGASKMLSSQEDTPVRGGLEWVFAKRGVLILSDTHLTCGSWRLPLDQVEQASHMEIGTLFSRGLVLKLAAQDGTHYRFGLSWDSAWTGQSALQLQRDDSPLGHSPFAIVYRLVVVAIIVYLLASGEFPR